jgi:hypothetical protein
LVPINLALANGVIVSDPRVLDADGNGKKFDVSLRKRFFESNRRLMQRRDEQGREEKSRGAATGFSGSSPF